MSDGAPLVLEQVGGSIVVRLAGPDLPDQGITDRVGVRVRREWLPGADVPDVQVLGAEYAAMELTGEFDDAATGIDGGATEAMRQLQRMALAGLPVRLTWGEIWDRTGYVESAQGTRRRGGRQGWSLTFTPHAIRDIGTEMPTVRYATVPLAQIEAVAKAMAALAAASLARQRAAALQMWARTMGVG